MNKLGFLLVVLSACGGGGGADKGTVNTQNARQSVDQVGAVSASMAAMNGSMAASAVQQMTAAGQGIVSPSQPMGRVLGLLPAFSGKPDIIGATGSAECTATQCTFTNYGDTGFLINGTISKSGDTHTFDVTYDVTSAGTKLKWNIDGAVTITPTSIDGTVKSSGDSSFEGNTGAGGVEVTWDVEVDYDALVLDGAHCPTGGSVRARSSYSVSGMTGYDVEGTATFGPSCGEAK